MLPVPLLPVSPYSRARSWSVPLTGSQAVSERHWRRGSASLFPHTVTSPPSWSISLVSVVAENERKVPPTCAHGGWLLVQGADSPMRWASSESQASSAWVWSCEDRYPWYISK